MNSGDGAQQNGVGKDSSDTNANVKDESKGAIPKKKPRVVASKKTNNNVEELIYTHDLVIRNGFLRKDSSNYLDYSDSDAENDHLPCHSRSKVAFERAALNIPLEDDFLGEVCVPVGPKFDDQSFFRNRENEQSDSSSDDNELLSLSDDGCIYTYKGDQVADLPSSFFSFEIPPLEEPAPNERQGEYRDASSPEMDFLEMDFDPGPSGDADSDSISNTEIDAAASLPLDPKRIEEPKPCCSKDFNREAKSDVNFDKNKFFKDAKLESNTSSDDDNASNGKFLNVSKNVEKTKEVAVLPRIEIKMPWSCSYSERTRTAKSLRVIKRHHSPKGELSSPSENGDSLANLSSFHNITGKISIDDKNSSSDIEKVMIWTNHEACLKQVTQIAPSSCGATAVLNVLKALRFPVPSTERLQECVTTKLRANSGSLTKYLLSRSVAGCTHKELITGLYKLSDKKIYARFFHMYPERLVNLQLWLGYWIKNGAVPIATINLQKCRGTIPDSWHHQMIFGVGPEGIYLANPLECVDPNQLWPQLSSESVLLVRKEDVMSRWNPRVDLPDLMKIDDVRWHELNVVGQVAKIVRESRRKILKDHVPKTHIKIPAEYRAGITLAVNMDSEAFDLLSQCPELPLLHPEDVASAFKPILPSL